MQMEIFEVTGLFTHPNVIMQILHYNAIAQEKNKDLKKKIVDRKIFIIVLIRFHVGYQQSNERTCTAKRKQHYAYLLCVK